MKQKNLSLLQLNISSPSCHINDIVNFLALRNTRFDAICITETRLSPKNPLTTNTEMSGYNIEQTPNESSPGRTLIIYYILYIYVYIYIYIYAYIYMHINNI